MRITHHFGNSKISKKVERGAGFLLTNKKGGFFSLGIGSKYRGLFFRYKGDALKVIDDIKVDGEITELRNQFWNVVRCRESTCESFFMPFGTNALVYELSEESEAEFLFDVKKAYDSRAWGRQYSVKEENGKIIIEFTKKTDKAEDSSHGEEEFKFFVVVDTKTDSLKILDEWVNQSYTLDKERNSFPAERFVYKAFRIRCKKAIIAGADDKEEAFKICDNIKNHLSKYKSLQKKYIRVSIKPIKNAEINMAAKCAIEALDNLLVNYGTNSVNLYAGLPWFFQFWSRDAMISLRALMLDKEYDTVKRILMEYLRYIEDDGLLPNRVPETVTKSADGIGWHFKRWHDFFDILRDESQLKHYFRKSEIDFIVTKLEDAINGVFKNYTVDSLAVNKEQETWMDTKSNGDGRKGARIEVQALRILMYDFLYRLTENRIYKDMVERLIKRTKELFWTGDYLKDGVDDSRIRPNVFIAAYIYPELLTKIEWRKCFGYVLPKLWLEWGGLSTLDKSEEGFLSDYTGEDSRSYHHGDSWYWLNNLVALVLYRTDYERFREYVDKIVEASCEDILFDGFIGCHSELSSASRRRSQGCLNQAWSNAMFLELVEEMHLNNQGRD